MVAFTNPSAGWTDNPIPDGHPEDVQGSLGNPDEMEGDFEEQEFDENDFDDDFDDDFEEEIEDDEFEVADPFELDE